MKLIAGVLLVGLFSIRLFNLPPPVNSITPKVEFISQWDFKEMKYIKIREQKSKLKHEIRNKRK